LFGRHAAEEELSINGSTIYMQIQKLKVENQISIKSNNQYSLITICNYDSYQSREDDYITTKEQPTNKQTTNKAHQSSIRVTAREQLSNTYNKDNKANNEELMSVVTFLNEKTGKEFKANTKSTVRLVGARIVEGRTVEELKSVIEQKAKQWLHDEKFNKFLRPQTLFGEKFESYLNETKRLTQNLPVEVKKMII
jgi:uncharacterized phage protein (TIGR02220 family)